jgi:hypothetical protein
MPACIKLSAACSLSVLKAGIVTLNPVAGFTSSDWDAETFYVGFMVNIILLSKFVIN